jgi:hypothetical protein
MFTEEFAEEGRSRNYRNIRVYFQMRKKMRGNSRRGSFPVRGQGIAGVDSPFRGASDVWHGFFRVFYMKSKQKPVTSGAHYKGTPPIQHSEIVLAPTQKEEPAKRKAGKKAETRSINDDDIEADRHNGSGGAFEATEKQLDDEE